MLISAIPPTFPWPITGLSPGPFLSPMACRFNMKPSRFGCHCISDMAATPSMGKCIFPMMHLPVMCGCWSVNCLHLMFSGQSHYVSKINLLLLSPGMFLSLCAIHPDNQTAFQYTWLRIIISHQTSLSNALLRILHRNEICPLSMNPSTPHPWLCSPPH